MRIFILVCLILSCSKLIGQTQTFTFNYITEDDDRLWDALETEDGNFYLAGHIALPESKKYKGLIIKIGSDGYLVDEKVINIPHRAYDIYKIIQDAPGSIILCGKSSDTTPEMLNTYLELKRINLNMETSDSATYLISYDKFTGMIGINHGFNNDLLFTGGLLSDSPPYSHAYMLRLNQELDSIHFHQFTAGSSSDQINQLTDSTYWCVGSFSGYKYMILDSNFNYLDHAKVPNRLAQAYGLKWDTDTSFFMAGEWGGGPDDDLGILRQYHPLDTTGHIFNSWGTEGIYDYPAPNGAIDFRHKDSVFVGAISPFQPFLWGNYPSDFVLLQTDSLLNIRWERFYGSGEYYYELMKVLATSDGGCLLAGTRYNYNSGVHERDIFVVKLDREGLLVGKPDHEINITEALVFPNPGTNYLKVRVAAQYKHSTFDLFDMNGRKVLSRQITGKWGEVNTTFLLTGTYIYNIYNSDGLFESGKWVKR